MYTYIIEETTRKKAIRFSRINGPMNNVQPSAYASINGFWIDLYNEETTYRAEFGPYMSRSEAETAALAILDIANNGVQWVRTWPKEAE